MKKIMVGVVMLCMFAFQMNSFGMDTENAKRVMQYLSFRAGSQKTKRLQHFDDEKSVANTNFCIYTANGLPAQHIKIGFGPRNVIGSGKNLPYLCRLVFADKPVGMMALKEKIDMKNKERMSVWGVKRKRVHMGRMGERKFQLMNSKR